MSVSEKDKIVEQADMIARLSKENALLRQEIEIQKGMTEACNKKISDLQKQINKLMNGTLESNKGRNERGAGRKKDDDRIMAKRDVFFTLQNDGAGMIEIMDKMQISRSTFFRLKKYVELAREKGEAPELEKTDNAMCD